MVAPLLAGAAKVIGSAGLWTGASKVFRGAIPKAKGAIDDAVRWIKGNPASAGKGLLGAGALGGAWTTVSDALDAVGIKDGQLQVVVVAGLGLAGVAAVGQLLDIQIGGGS